MAFSVGGPCLACAHEKQTPIPASSAVHTCPEFGGQPVSGDRQHSQLPQQSTGQAGPSPQGATKYKTLDPVVVTNCDICKGLLSYCKLLTGHKKSGEDFIVCIECYDSFEKLKEKYKDKYNAHHFEFWKGQRMKQRELASLAAATSGQQAPSFVIKPKRFTPRLLTSDSLPCPPCHQCASKDTVLTIIAPCQKIYRCMSCAHKFLVSQLPNSAPSVVVSCQRCTSDGNGVASLFEHTCSRKSVEKNVSAGATASRGNVCVDCGRPLANGRSYCRVCEGEDEDDNGDSDPAGISPPLLGFPAPAVSHPSVLLMVVLLFAYIRGLENLSTPDKSRLITQLLRLADPKELALLESPLPAELFGQLLGWSPDTQQLLLVQRKELIRRLEVERSFQSVMAQVKKRADAREAEFIALKPLIELPSNLAHAHMGQLVVQLNNLITVPQEMIADMLTIALQELRKRSHNKLQELYTQSIPQNALAQTLQRPPSMLQVPLPPQSLTQPAQSKCIRCTHDSQNLLSSVPHTCVHQNRKSYKRKLTPDDNTSLICFVCKDSNQLNSNIRFRKIPPNTNSRQKDIYDRSTFKMESCTICVKCNLAWRRSVSGLQLVTEADFLAWVEQRRASLRQGPALASTLASKCIQPVKHEKYWQFSKNGFYCPACANGDGAQ